MEVVIDVIMCPYLLNDQFLESVSEVDSVLIWLLKSLQLLEDLILTALFIFLFVKFSGYKLEHLRQEGQRLTLLNIFWMVWISLLILI